ncbi:WD repeat-containing protein 91-like isoform X2 [Orbicella faveolata]|uniref:WD repeat-containing protein 91-like isoform X2 n=1 Tax=Orbicella faveolata TaxID=48498 RepID=UPI0009E5A1D1|nr:WD repeat-containing protein 91-like isoform X2 [Orbicella faveolata]
MAAAIPMLDDVIKEYLVFRAFSNTLKSFESDLKADKDKSFRVDKIVDQLYQYILSYDIVGLRDFWDYLNDRFFKRLDYQHNSNVKKLEMCLLRLYIVHAIQNSKNDKVVEFFEKYTAELQTQTEWREWFAIPFIKNPEQNVTFEMYFQRAWQETFFLSLYNFLITLFHHMPMPTILKYDEERGKLHRLEQEVLKLKEQVVSLADEAANLQRQKSKLEQELAESQRKRGDTVEEEDMDEFFVVTRPQVQSGKFLPSVSKKFSKLMFKDKQEKNKKGKDPKQQQQQQMFHGEQMQAKLKRQQLVRQQQQQQIQEQQKQLSLLQGEQLKSSSVLMSQEKPQGQEVEVENESQNDEEDAKPLKSSISKTQSLDTPSIESLDDKEKSGFSIQRSKTLPGRLKTSQLELEDRTDDTLRKSALLEGHGEHKSKAFIFLSQDGYKEHHSAIVHCRFSSSGRMIGSADADGIVKVWTHHPDIQTCGTIMSKSPLLSLEWAPKPDRLLLLGTGNGKVKFYDTENKKPICDVATDSQYPRIVSLSCSPTGGAFVCSAAANKKSVTSSLRLSQSFSKYSEMSTLTSNSLSSSSGVLQCWDMKAMRVERQLPLDPVPTCINCTAFNHNATLCISGGSDGMIRLFDMRSFDCLIGWQAHEGEVCSIQFSADETTAYSMGTDGKFSQWSVHRMGQKMTDLDIHDGAVWCETEGPGLSHGKTKFMSSPSSYGRMFAFDAEGQYLLSCGPESGVVYKVEKSQGLCQVLSLPAEHKSPVVSVDWSSSMSCYTCLTGSVDGSIQVTSLLKH